MTEIESKKQSRAAHRGIATRYFTEVESLLLLPVDQVTDQNVVQLERTESRLTSKLAQLQSLDEQYQALIEPSALEDDIVDATTFNDKVFDNCDTVKRFIKSVKAKQSELSALNVDQSYSLGSVSNTAELKLPKISLPTFSGSYTDWMSFIDLFNGSVDSNSRLNNSQKLHYLKSSLRGDAAKLLASITISDSNYETAKEILLNRYSNPRLISRAHVQSILALPSCDNENSACLRKLIETVEEHRLALKNLGHNVDEQDLFLLHIVVDKLGPITRQEWELSTPGTELQKFDQLKVFLQNRCCALEAAESVAKNSKDSKLKVSSDKQKDFKSFSQRQSTENQVYSSVSYSTACEYCNKDHRLYACPSYQNLPVNEKSIFVKRQKLCFNCLKTGHTLSACKSSNCKHCNKKHHSSLHRFSESQNHVLETQPFAEDERTVGVGHMSTQKNCVLLPTAIVPISFNGVTIPCRALLDSGAQSSLITEHIVQKLNLPKKKLSINVSGIGGNVKIVNPSSVVIPIQLPDKLVPVEAIVLPKITGFIPNTSVQSSHRWKTIKHLKLADPDFLESNTIDLLLGSDVVEQFMLDTRIQESPSIYLRESVFGWVVQGSLKQQVKDISVNFLEVDGEFSLEKFWALENVPNVPLRSKEEKQCEDHFTNTTTRDVDGLFVVKLPFKTDVSQLGDSLSAAERRFKSLESKLDRDVPLKKRYCDFINEFMDLKHMEEVPPGEIEIDSSKVFYLPHHCVFKESSTTTKLRVVFDASAKTSSGYSLNDCLLVGPKIQNDLFSILLRFRFYTVVFSADIAKMYRQVKLAEDDRNFHRILWREKKTDEIKHLRMTRVTYGVASSAYHSIRALQEMAKETTNKQISEIILNDMYVDDLLSGCFSFEEAIDLQSEIISLLKSGGFDLRKWTSNKPDLVRRLDKSYHESGDDTVFDRDDYLIKTLGASWSPNTDQFSFNIELSDEVPNTKRSMLSEITSLFDPLGWLSPVIISMKIFMQALWKLQLTWDEKLPKGIIQEYQVFRQSLPEIEKLFIARQVIQSALNEKLTFHIFCDASEKAYAATIYLRSENSGNVKVSLLVAKTRVAPVKSVSVPRLELCAALLGANLAEAIQNSFKDSRFDQPQFMAWTDSTIVLSWLAQTPDKWKTFVRNRVSKIQEILPHSLWRHVPTSDNPADCASRGLSCSDLMAHNLWWSGPSWLSKPMKDWPNDDLDFLEPQFLPEQQKQKVSILLTAKFTPVFELERYSSFSKVIRIVNFVQRFLHSLKQECFSFEKVEGLTHAEILILRQEQQRFFFEEIQILKAGKGLKASHNLLALCPFLDDQSHLIRVGGRLSQSTHSTLKKFPVLIPRESILCNLIVRHFHEKTLHGGCQLTLFTIRQRFWFIKAKTLVKQVIRSCVTCARFSYKPSAPLMGDLPAERIQKSRPFSVIGLDYAGYFMVRTPKLVKIYIAIFICLVTKAIHLEVVFSLTKESCINAIKRFAARRGMPTKIFSDNASAFLASRTEIMELERHLNSCFRTEWSMIPSRSPHFGGLWEAGVKSIKHHLRRTMGAKVLYIECFCTLLNDIESILNSRPLVSLSEDPNDISAITPAHFLIGSPLTSFPESIPKKQFSLKNVQSIDSLRQEFWKVWSRDYLSQLQTRNKWKAATSNLKIDDLVLVNDDHLSPLQWPLGRITKIFKGNDDNVRVVEVRTQNWTGNRPVIKLLRLPTNV